MRSSVLDLEPCAGAEETASGAREIRRMDSEYIPKKTQPLRYKSRRESSSLGQCHDTRVHETHELLRYTVRVKHARGGRVRTAHGSAFRRDGRVIMIPLTQGQMMMIMPMSGSCLMI